MSVVHVFIGGPVAECGLCFYWRPCLFWDHLLMSVISDVTEGHVDVCDDLFPINQRC